MTSVDAKSDLLDGGGCNPFFVESFDMLTRYSLALVM
jgi:hypothetical protein